MKLNNNNVYSEELLKDLYSRMEEPNPHSKIINLFIDRWDNPMIKLNFGEEIDYEAIFSSIVEGKKPRDPVSTKNVKIVLNRISYLIQISFSN